MAWGSQLKSTKLEAHGFIEEAMSYELWGFKL
jgi:hypothetical protein